MLTNFTRMKQYALLQCVQVDKGSHQLKPNVTQQQYHTLKRTVSTLETIATALGGIEVFHVAGTSTILLHMELCNKIYEHLCGISGIPLELMPRKFFQKAPDTLVLKQLTCRDDVVALYREIQPFKDVNKHHPLKKVNINPDKLTRARKLKAAAQNQLALVREYFPTTRMVCIDVEAFEFKQSKLLEIGIAYKDNAGNITAEHLIIADNLKYKNGKYVPNNRDHFLFGQSRTVTLQEAIARVELVLSDADCLVGHSVKDDIDFLRKHLSAIQVPEKVADTAYLGRCVLEQEKRTPSLGDLMNHYQITCDKLHNAGNDAMVTLMVLSKMVA